MVQEFQTSDLNDVRIHLVPIGEGLKGFVYVSKRNVPYIFIEESLSTECIAKTLAHETYHIKHDKSSYGLGLDKQHSESEQKANNYATSNTKRLLSLINPTAI